MSKKIVDCRGLSCPQPVLETKQALETSEKVTVVVDNTAARDNVARFGEGQGGKVAIQEKEDGIYIKITKPKGGKHSKQTQSSHCPTTGPVVAIIRSDQMGQGEEKLGQVLIRSFLHTLTEVSPSPDTMIFFNTGVRLTSQGSEVLDDLQALEQKGVALLVCGTCLDYFGLKEKIAVGRISNMYTIAETMLSAGHLVTV